MSGFARQLAARARGGGAVARPRLTPRVVPATAAGRTEWSGGVPLAAHRGGASGESTGGEAAQSRGAPPLRGDGAAPARPAGPAPPPSAPGAVQAIRPPVKPKELEERAATSRPAVPATAKRAPVVAPDAAPAARAVVVRRVPQPSAGMPAPIPAAVRAAPRMPAPRPATAAASAPPIEVRIGRVEVGLPAVSPSGPP